MILSKETDRALVPRCIIGSLPVREQMVAAFQCAIHEIVQCSDGVFMLGYHFRCVAAALVNQFDVVGVHYSLIPLFIFCAESDRENSIQSVTGLFVSDSQKFK